MAIAHRASSTAATTANATSLVCNVPSGVQDGDVMLMAIVTGGPAVTTLTAPGGWVEEVNKTDATVAHRFVVLRRVASSEPATYTANVSNATSIVMSIDAYSGAGTDLEAVASGSDLTNDTTLTNNGVTTLSDNAWAWYGYSVGESDPPTTLPITEHGSTTARSEVGSTGSAVGRGLCTADEVRATAGATGARNATSSAVSRNHWAALSLKARASIPVFMNLYRQQGRA